MRFFPSLITLTLAWTAAMVNLLPIEWVALIVALIGMIISVLALLNSFQALDIVKDQAHEEKEQVKKLVSQSAEIDDKLPDHELPSLDE